MVGLINEKINSAKLQIVNENYKEAEHILSDFANDFTNFNDDLLEGYLLYAKILFLNGKIAEVENYLLKILELSKNKIKVKEALLEFYNNNNEIKKGVEIALTLINNINELSEEALYYCVDVLELEGIYDKALIFCERLYLIDNLNDELKERYEKLSKLSRGYSFKDATIHYTENDIDIFYKLFRGRENVFAKQVQTKEGSFGYHPVYEPLKHEHIKMHFDGDITLGSYTVTLDNCCYYLAIDVDIKKTYQYKFEKSNKTKIFAKIKDTLRKIKTISQYFGLSPVFEFSGNKGFHVWYFFIEPISCKIARKIGNYIIYKLGVWPLELSFEVFPKQDEVKPGGIGNLIKLPLGVHLKTNTRGVFVDDNNFDAYENQFEFLRSIKRHTREDIDLILGRIAEDNKANLKEKGYFNENVDFKSKNNVDENIEKANEPIIAPVKEFKTLPISILDSKNLPEIIQKVLAGCKILWNIVRKANEQHILNHIEKHVFIYVFTALGESGQIFIHQILSKCVDYDPDKVLREIRAVPPNPISCPKIRKSMKDLAELIGCRCVFELPPKTYPSPLIYASIFPHSEEKLQTTADKYYEDKKLIGSSYIPNDIDMLMFKIEHVKSEIQKYQLMLEDLQNVVKKMFSEKQTNLIESNLATYEIIYNSEDKFEIVKKDKK